MLWPLRGFILQGKTCQIFILVENPRWGPSVTKTNSREYEIRNYDFQTSSCESLQTVLKYTSLIITLGSEGGEQILLEIHY